MVLNHVDQSCKIPAMYTYFASFPGRDFCNSLISVSISTIGDKIVETFYSNRITLENKRIHTPLLSPPFKVGVFVVFYRLLEHRHNMV